MHIRYGIESFQFDEFSVKTKNITKTHTHTFKRDAYSIHITHPNETVFHEKFRYDLNAIKVSMTVENL